MTSKSKLKRRIKKLKRENANLADLSGGALLALMEGGHPVTAGDLIVKTVKK